MQRHQETLCSLLAARTQDSEGLQATACPASRSTVHVNLALPVAEPNSAHEAQLASSGKETPEGSVPLHAFCAASPALSPADAVAVHAICAPRAPKHGLAGYDQAQGQERHLRCRLCSGRQ